MSRKPLPPKAPAAPPPAGAKAPARKAPAATSSPLAQRLRETIAQMGISQLEAVRRMNDVAKARRMEPVSAEFVRDTLNGKKRSIGSDALLLMAEALHRTPNWLLGLDESGFPPPVLNGTVGLVEVPVVGRIELNRWSEPDSLEPAQTIHIAPLAGYAPDDLVAYYVHGRGADAACPDGSVAIVAAAQNGSDIREGDILLVERTRGGLVERSLRRVERRAGKWVLVAPSTDPALRNDAWPLAGREAPLIVGRLAAAQIAFPRASKADV